MGATPTSQVIHNLWISTASHTTSVATNTRPGLPSGGSAVATPTPNRHFGDAARVGTKALLPSSTTIATEGSTYRDDVVFFLVNHQRMVSCGVTNAVRAPQRTDIPSDFVGEKFLCNAQTRQFPSESRVKRRRERVFQRCFARVTSQLLRLHPSLFAETWPDGSPCV